MEKWIKKFVAMYFDDIPYSEEISKAQKNIENALHSEFDKLSEDSSKGDAMEEIVSKYGRLSDMAELAGYSAESAQKWRLNCNVIDLKPLKKEMSKQRRRINLISLLTVGGFVQLLWIFYQIFGKPLWAFFNLLYATVLFLLAFITFRKLRKTEKGATGEKYDTDSYSYLRLLSDKYSKRTLNSIALLFAVVFIFFYFELRFYVFGNSKTAELAENFLNNIIVVEIPLFMLLKNMLLSEMVRNRIKFPDKVRIGKHRIGIMTFSAVYWLSVTIITAVLRRDILYPVNILIIAGAMFVLLMLLYDLTLRKKVTFRNIVINKLRITVCTAMVVCISGFLMMQQDTWYTQNYINTVPVVRHNNHKIEYNDDTGVYTITSSTDDFKILHLTDIHLGGSLYSYRKDMKALRACYAEIEHTQPDLVIVTGDLCFPMGIMSMSLNNTAPINQFAAFMRNIGIPWAFTYGNHDTESFANADKKELNEIFKSLSYKTSGNLLYPYTQPDITGRNNQLIVLCNSDGSLNTALFMIDSNAYTGDGINVYDYIHDDQVEWYTNEVKKLNEEAGHTVNSLVFIHIPLQEYLTATELYEQGSDEVKYFFGENPGDHGGVTNDKVCCSDFPSKLFETALNLGSTSGFFCGHDHYNNMSVEYKGIRLTYGMSIDYLAMPGIENETRQRGAELITLHPDSSWDLEQMPLTQLQ